MTEPAKQLRGARRNADGSVIEIVADILQPEFEEERGYWCCVVRCPSLFSADKRIVGVDAEQALDLAEGFIRQIFGHNRIVLGGDRPS